MLGEPERNARPDQRRPRMSIANYLPPVSNMLRCMCIGINDPVESHQTHAARTADVKTPQVDATDANKFDFTQTAQSTIRYALKHHFSPVQKFVKHFTLTPIQDTNGQRH